MKITEIETRVLDRRWLTERQMRSAVMDGYKCNWNQADALIDIGIRNKMIEHDSEKDMYRVIETINKPQPLQA